MCRYFLSFLRYKEINSRNCQKKYKFSYFLGHRVKTPWPIWKFCIKTCASLSPKYWTTFDDAQAITKGSCPIHENEYPHPQKCSTPVPGAPMGWSSPNYLVPVPGVCSTLQWAKISRRSHSPALRYPQPYKQKTNKQTKSKLNITPNATLYGEIIKSGRLTTQIRALTTK